MPSLFRMASIGSLVLLRIVFEARTGSQHQLYKKTAFCLIETNAHVFFYWFLCSYVHGPQIRSTGKFVELHFFRSLASISGSKDVLGLWSHLQTHGSNWISFLEKWWRLFKKSLNRLLNDTKSHGSCATYCNSNTLHLSGRRFKADKKIWPETPSEFHSVGPKGYG